MAADSNRITLAQVAEAAAVSPAAASLALRNRPGVAKTTRNRVLSIAKELGYRVRSQPGRPTTIGLLVKVHPDDEMSSNSFYGPVIAGITDSCRAGGINVRLAAMPVDEHFDPVEIPPLVNDTMTDGLLVLGAFLSIRAAAALGAQPIVLVDGYAAEPDTFLSIVTDNVGGMQTATQHLIDHGHERIVLAGTAADAYPSIRQRRDGYIEAMRRAGLEPQFVDGSHSQPSDVAAAVASMLLNDRSLSAVVCGNDIVALACCAEIHHQGLLVPGDISVVGFDDIEGARQIRPGLDTIAVGKPAMGRIAVSMLRHRIEFPNDPAFTVVQHTHVVKRESVRQIRNQARRRRRSSRSV